MANGLLSLLLFLVYSGFAQTNSYQLPTPKQLSIQQEKLGSVRYLNDFHTQLWDNLSMEYSERMRLEQRRTGAAPQPANYVYPQENYKQVLEVTSMKITVTSKGLPVSAATNSDQLSSDQLALLSRADLGSQIKIQLLFKYKDRSPDAFGPRDEAVEAEAGIQILPQQAASFPGGQAQLSAFFGEEVVNKLSSEWDRKKLGNAVVRFTVRENGEVKDVSLASSSGDKKIDSLLLSALKQMPAWKPAVNAQGIKVQQEVRIPFGDGC